MQIKNWRRVALWRGLLAVAALFFGGRSAFAQPAVLERPAEKSAEKQDEAAKPGEEWLRLLDDAAGKPLAMETAVVRYVPVGEENSETPSQYVDLVAAIHIGDKAYYEKLNKRFEQYDAVLFELVAPKGVRVPKGRGTSNTNPLGAMQNLMKNVLEVEHQLEKIDYTKANFVHADLSPDEFRERMAERDESFLKLFIKMMGASMAQQSQQAARGESADLDMAAALFAEDRARQLKIAISKQFLGMDVVMSALSGPEGSTLITDRNLRALEVLKEEQAAGKKRLAIFYGAGHLDDIDKRMKKDFNMVPASVEWIEAWDLREK